MGPIVPGWRVLAIGLAALGVSLAPQAAQAQTHTFTITGNGAIEGESDPLDARVTFNVTSPGQMEVILTSNANVQRNSHVLTGVSWQGAPGEYTKGTAELHGASILINHDGTPSSVSPSQLPFHWMYDAGTGQHVIGAAGGDPSLVGSGDAFQLPGSPGSVDYGLVGSVGPDFPNQNQDPFVQNSVRFTFTFDPTVTPTFSNVQFRYGSGLNPFSGTVVPEGPSGVLLALGVLPVLAVLGRNRRRSAQLE